MKINAIILSLLTLASFCAHGEVSVQVLCFSSDGSSPIRFEFRTYYDQQAKWSGGFVKYYKSKIAIPVVMADSHAETAGTESPSLFTGIWLEISGKKITGNYELVSQGTSVNSMIYTNMASMKKYYFNLVPNVDSSIKDGCAW